MIMRVIIDDICAVIQSNLPDVLADVVRAKRMSTFDSLNDTFDVSAEIVKVEEEPTVKPIKRNKKPLIISDKGEDKEKDYQYARAQIYDIVEKMQESLNGAMEVAQPSPTGVMSKQSLRESKVLIRLTRSNLDHH